MFSAMVLGLRAFSRSAALTVKRGCFCENVCVEVADSVQVACFRAGEEGEGGVENQASRSWLQLYKMIVLISLIHSITFSFCLCGVPVLM